MKITKFIILNFITCLLMSSSIFCQSDKEQIFSIRDISNKALESYDYQKAFSFLTEDVFITTGNGTHISGRKALLQYVEDNNNEKMYWVRSAKEIVINESRGLAWEEGIWNGYHPNDKSKSIVNGNYAAMWSKVSGQWKIKSELFVALQEKLP